MSHEISQFEISGHQLLESNELPKEGEWTDIGEAQVTETIFGKAKVRVIHAHDKQRNAWLLIALGLVVTVLSVTGWQWWNTSQPTEAQPGEVSTSSLSSKEPAATPAPQSVYSYSPYTSPTVVSVPKATPLPAISKPAIIAKSAPQPTPALKNPGQMPVKQVAPQTKPVMAPQTPIAVQAKPVTTQILVAGKPLSSSPLTNNSVLKDPAAMQHLPTPAPVKPVPPVAATPALTSPVNKPVIIPTLASPLIKEDSAPPPSAPASDTQPPAASPN